MRIVIIVPFLNEEEHLDALLSAIERQRRSPDRLLLVDDGSDDRSLDIAERFVADHAYASVLRRPRRPPARDRLAAASELVAFQWALGGLEGDYEIVAKLDADIELSPHTLSYIEREMERDPRLGIAGTFLSVNGPDGNPVRERCPPYHVRGATKFYRRSCLDQISPLPTILGWDTIDESEARMHGWRTASLEIPGGDPIHRRPTGAAGGTLRAYSRWGVCAYAAGFHPVWILLSTVRRLVERPRLIGAGAYLAGWASAIFHRQPRADPKVRKHVRHEQFNMIVHRQLP